MDFCWDEVILASFCHMMRKEGTRIAIRENQHYALSAVDHREIAWKDCEYEADTQGRPIQESNSKMQFIILYTFVLDFSSVYDIHGSTSTVTPID